MSIVEEIKEILKRYFEEARKSNLSYKKVQWELDNFIYPYIGSYLASGELSKEEAKEIFVFCETELKKLKNSLSKKI
uniref:Pyruvate carboxylase subunit B n=1 Tax=Geoglobus ahangari TaxID=113653 RepID=A0A7C4S5X4_9EURY